MAVFTLTTGNDTIVAPDEGSTVFATAATLNPGDSLTGGAGTDTLVLVGGGTFHVDTLANFTGFENIKVENTGGAGLWLGGQPVEIDITGSLGIYVSAPADWNVSDVIKGDASQTFATASLNFFNFSFPQQPTTYDLTSNAFSGIGSIGALSDNISLLINSADTAAVQSFYSGNSNDRLVTASSTLDLSHTRVSGFAVVSANGVGTTFTVADLGTALQIAGGPGHDTLVGQGFTFTADERDAVFATSSIETIIDPSGTYNAPPPSPGVIRLTTNNDTFVAPATGSTVYATAATLNPGDSLTGGAGTDTLVLVGGGAFHVDTLASFTGFENIKVENTGGAGLWLGGQPVEIDITGSLGIYVSAPADWNVSDVIKGDASQTFATASLNFFNFSFPQQPATYDLTSNAFSGIGSVGALSDNISLLINSADTAAVQSFSREQQRQACDRQLTLGTTVPWAPHCKSQAVPDMTLLKQPHSHLQKISATPSSPLNRWKRSSIRVERTTQLTRPVTAQEHSSAPTVVMLRLSGLLSATKSSPPMAGSGRSDGSVAAATRAGSHAARMCCRSASRQVPSISINRAAISGFRPTTPCSWRVCWSKRST